MLVLVMDTTRRTSRFDVDIVLFSFSLEGKNREIIQVCLTLLFTLYQSSSSLLIIQGRKLSKS